MGFLSATLLASAVLLDQTVAVVGPTILTQSEVRAEALLHNVLDGRKLLTETDAEDRALDRMIRRTVIDNYLDNLGLIPAVPEDRKAALRERLRARLAGREVPEATLDRLLTSRIRSEIFMEDHLPFRITVTEEDVRAYYETEKERRFLRKPFESVAQIVRADLQRDRLKKELEKWLETEMRRTQVVLLHR
jgi:hypothetical protein